MIPENKGMIIIACCIWSLIFIMVIRPLSKYLLRILKHNKAERLAKEQELENILRSRADNVREGGYYIDNRQEEFNVIDNNVHTTDYGRKKHFDTSCIMTSSADWDYKDV